MPEGQAPEPAAIPGRDVFISYASQDASVANKLVETLERHGIRCWIAPRDVKAGAQYADAIIRALTNARVMVLVLSAHSIASSHVGKEIERASSKKRPIIALRTDLVPLTPALEYFLSESQWIEVQEGKAETAYAKLIDAIRDPERDAPKGASAAPAATAPPALRRAPTLLAIGLAIAALIMAAFFAPKLWLAGHSPAGETTNLASTPAVPINDNSIAVLPFVDMSEKHDQEYFGDGMAEEILNLLVKVPGLTVIGRTSSFQFKGKDDDLRTIGAKLNAAYVLEGSVRNSGDQVRITAQLINTRTGAHEWSETYDRKFGDVLKLQDAVAAAVARRLELAVPPNASEIRASLKSVDAYKLLLRSWHALDRQDKEGFEEAATLARQALDLDPTSAIATATLAWVYESQGEFGFVAPADGFERARLTAMAALKLDPKEVNAHGVLARIHVVYDWDWSAAHREYQQVAMLAPGSDSALDRGDLALALGRWDEALSDAKAALTVDPLSSWHYLFLSWVQARRGDLPAAEAAVRRTLDISPTYTFAHYYLGLILIARGNHAGALEAIQQEVSEEGRLNGLALAYQALGKKAEADAALGRMLKEQAQSNAFGIAEAYAARGQTTEALHWLERAYAQKDASLFYVKGDLPLKSIESDPRYKAFLRKMNLPE